MRTPVRSPLLLLLLAGALASCHSDAFAPLVPLVGAHTTGSDVRLTYNPEQDYWPIWSEDRSAIVYAYVNSTSDPVAVRHRCIGAMPAGGGQRFWQWCDNGATQRDSLSSFGGYALGRDGRLLYFESVSGKANALQIDESSLWLADTAAPRQRRRLVTLPIVLGDSVISWLSSLQWTGHSSFLALGQHFRPIAHCICSPFDTLFAGGAIVTGSVTADGAIVGVLTGTDGATAYDLVSPTGPIVFTLDGSAILWQVPLGGGIASAIDTLQTAGAPLTGVSCMATGCIVAVGVTHGDLRFVPLAGGPVTQLRSDPGAYYSTPLLDAAHARAVVQSGMMIGHARTLLSSAQDLYLVQITLP